MPYPGHYVGCALNLSAGQLPCSCAAREGEEARVSSIVESGGGRMRLEGVLKQSWFCPNKGAALGDQVDVPRWSIGGEDLLLLLESFDGCDVVLEVRVNGPERT